MKKVFTVLLISFFCSFNIYSATITWDGDSDGDGDNWDWDNPLNWDLELVPSSTDDVILNLNNSTIYIWYTDVNCNSITISNGASLYVGFTGSSVIRNLNAQNLDIKAAINSPPPNPVSNPEGTIHIGNGSEVMIAGVFKPDGVINFDLNSTISYTGNNQNIIPVSAGYQNLILSGSGTKTTTGDIVVNGDFSIGATVSLDAKTNSNNFIFSGSSDQIIEPANFYNLTFSGTGAKVLSSSGIYGISGTFTPATYTGATNINFEYNGTAGQTIAAIQYGDLTISGNKGGGTVTFPSGNLNVAGAFSNTASNASFSTTGNTFIYNGTSAQSAGAFTYNNLTINNSNDVTLTGNTIVDGTLSLSTGVLNVDTYTLTLNGPTSRTSGSISSDATGIVNYDYTGESQVIRVGNYGVLNTAGNSKTFSTAGTIFIAAATNFAASSHSATNSTIEFNGGTGTQTIPFITYHNLNLSGVGDKTLGTLTIEGNISNTASGTVSITDGTTITYAGSGNQTVGSLPYKNLTINDRSGTVSFSGDISIANTFTAANSANIDYDPGTSTITFNGTSSQSIPAISYNNLALNNSGGATLAGSTTINGNLTLTSGNLSIGNATLTLLGNITTGTGELVGGSTSIVSLQDGVATPANGSLPAVTLAELLVSRSTDTVALSGNVAVTDNLSISAGGVLNCGANTLTLSGDFLNNGDFQPGSGTTNFSGTVSLDINSSGTFDFNNVHFPSTFASIAGKDFSVSGDWTNAAPGTNIGPSVTFTGADQDVYVDDQSFFQNFIVNGNVSVLENLAVNGNIELNGGSINLNNIIVTLSGNWSNTGSVVTPGSSTVKFGNNANQQITSNGQPFNNLSIIPDNTNIQVSLTDPLDVDGDFAVNDGGNLISNSHNITVAGDWSVSTGGSYGGGVFTAGTGLVTFDGTTVQNITTGGSAFHNLIIDGSSSKDLKFELNVNNNLTILTGATLNTNTFAMNVTNQFTNNGTFSNSSGTISLAGDLDNYGSFTSGSGAMSLTGNLTNGTGNIFNATSGDFTVNGNITNDGTFNSGSGEIIFAGTTSISGNEITFNNISITGTLNAPNSMVVNGGWSNSGTFNHQSGTVTFSSGSTAGTTGGTTFYNLTVNKTSGGALTLSSSSHEVINILELDSGTLNTGGNLNMVFNSSSTAKLAQVAPGTIISGNIIAHRHVEGSKTEGRYQFGPMVSNQTQSAWQD
ncbi:MAG: beta strand repeat-containing protein, partial [Candidatus Cyclobacteriaceae bacterium M3_2C_046]